MSEEKQKKKDIPNIIGITKRIYETRDERNINIAMLTIKTFNPIIDFGLIKHKLKIEARQEVGMRVFVHMIYQSGRLDVKLLTKEQLKTDFKDELVQDEEFEDEIDNYDMENTIPVYFEHTNRTKFFTVVTNLPWSRNFKEMAKLFDDVEKAYLLE